MIRLSICIPTYNRGAYLSDLLDSILEQWIDGLQVVISDNGSTDDTRAVIARWEKLVPSLKVIWHPVNIGPDRNFLSVVEAATGEFCWLMGSDDRIEPGGIARVMSAIDQWLGIAGFSVNMAAYDAQFLTPLPVGKAVDLDQDDVITQSDAAILTFMRHFGYLSAHVVRRSLWNEVCATGEPRQFLNAYVHVLIMGRMIQKVPCWGYVHQRCVGWRSGNDSFMADGWFNRMRIDVVGYSQIADAFWGHGSSGSRRMRSQIAQTHVVRHFSYAKTHGASPQSLRDSKRLFGTYLRDTPAYWTHLTPWMLVPQRASLIGRWIYRTIIKPHRK